ncbi:double-CXXCG motif protein [Myxococcus hansupus]|uniref:SitI6 family double-CXXCG motif immunity protein n=1 Tax=Pseudomyxococcus hansupus TaxID=1297742 RepID=UPI0005D10170|nr:double-CXXCG motif protein [Myxococcus hansupus]
MSRFFWMQEDRAATEKLGGQLNAWHQLSLPGASCDTCGETWASTGHEYPCIDVSRLPERKAFEKPRPEPFAEFARLRERVRPLAPPHAELPPGTGFGPLVGRASGAFGPIAWVWSQKLLVRHDALERLRESGVRGLQACDTQLRFRQADPPRLLELQIEPWGALHPDCIPVETPPPCQTCGRFGLSRPDAPILAAASLPRDVDLFRVGNFATMIIGTERLQDAVSRLSLDGITFAELPTR